MIRRLLARIRPLLLGACVSVLLANTAQALETRGTERRIVVALEEKGDPEIGAGATPRGYGGLPNYSGSDRATASAAAVARDHGLRQLAAWTIEPLRLRCMLYELAAGSDRAEALARLSRDRRVRLAQPLQEFRTWSTPADAHAPPRRAAAAQHYNDPYVGLQHGFSAIGAASAQRWSSGARVEIAVVDTGVDAGHPDLAGRVVSQRDFATQAAGPPAGDRHGTEVAGVIAAGANNGVGIVGVAPRAALRSYRACWPVAAGASEARCDTFTLAQAIGAAIASGARVINLSLGGPADPLLEQLLAKAVERGIVVVGAVPPDARMDGFPVDVAGVIAVRSDDMPGTDGSALSAPGKDILTLEPGGHYDYASGSSLATAHVTGAVALLLDLEPGLDAAAIAALLRASTRDAVIDACAAIRALAGRRYDCEAAMAGAEMAHAHR